MDFFTRQDQARRKTKWLVVYFLIAVILTIVAMYGVGVLVRILYFSKVEKESVPLWDSHLFLYIMLGTLAVVFFGSAYKTMALAGGGGAVAESLGGQRVDTNTTNLNERKLLNVVEEMSIASGVPMPQVYVLKGETGINAFAAGHSVNDAVVAVTEGCMTDLTRDELQGVIGHEFSHILNGDMRLNIRLISILFGIFCLATIGRILLYVRAGNSRGRNNNMLPLIGILLLIVGSIGVFFGRLIQAAVSRQREFLADASSVQFTRNPDGLSHALQKVGGRYSNLASPHAPDAAHLFFSNITGSLSLGSLLATHPPLKERIRAIDPSWDGKFRRPDDAIPYDKPLPPKQPPQPPINLGAAIAIGAMGTRIKTDTVLPTLGTPTPSHLEYAEKLRNELPENLKAAARAPLDACALVYALILSADDKQRAQQLAQISQRHSPAVSEKTAALFPDVVAVARRARLPLVNIALGALGQLTKNQFNSFSKTLDGIVNGDGKVEFFEFVLQKIVRHHLDQKFGVKQRVSVQYYVLKPLAPDCQVILSALAHVGTSDPALAQNAFLTGVPYLRDNDLALALLPLEQCGMDKIDAALERLSSASPLIKKNLVDSCVHVVGADGIILETEAELLRAVADTLDCPIPPCVN